MHRMQIAALAATAALVVATSSLKAQDAGALDPFLRPDGPRCVPLDAITKAAKVATLTPEQFQFVRALYVAIPPVSHELPPGDHAILAVDGNNAMAALVGDDQSCARLQLTDYAVRMLFQVGEGENGKAPGVDN